MNVMRKQVRDIEYDNEWLNNSVDASPSEWKW